MTDALAAAGWQAATAIQPVSTRAIDLTADEDALWGDLRKKWRQYVNKARTGGVRIVDAGPERLDEFYAIYRETADRAGFLIRARSAYHDVWQAYAPAGRARLLFAELPDGTPVATLFLVRAGDPRRRAVRRHDRGRRRQPRELPAQVGGDPQLARAGRDDATTCGASPTPGSRTSRRASAGARSTTSARTTSCSTRSGGGRTSSRRPRGSGWSGCGTACEGGSSASGVRGGRGRRRGRRMTAVRPAGRRRARRLGRASGGRRGRPRAPVAGLGRASRGARAGGAVPRRR